MQIYEEIREPCSFTRGMSRHQIRIHTTKFSASNKRDGKRKRKREDCIKQKTSQEHTEPLESGGRRGRQPIMERDMARGRIAMGSGNGTGGPNKKRHRKQATKSEVSQARDPCFFVSARPSNRGSINSKALVAIQDTKSFPSHKKKIRQRDTSLQRQ
jgi:hypothetical protein